MATKIVSYHSTRIVRVHTLECGAAPEFAKRLSRTTITLLQTGAIDVQEGWQVYACRLCNPPMPGIVFHERTAVIEVRQQRRTMAKIQASLDLDVQLVGEPRPREVWMREAKCRGQQWRHEEKNDELHEEHKAVCMTCPVRPECLDYALRNREFGTWGGTSHADRERIWVARGHKRRNQNTRNWGGHVEPSDAGDEWDGADEGSGDDPEADTSLPRVYVEGGL